MATRKSSVVKAKNTKRKPLPKFSKGRRIEVVTMGEGADAAKFTIRGLSYSEYIYLQTLDNQESHRDQIRLCLIEVENLKAENDKGDMETAKLTWETQEVDGIETKMLSRASFDDWFGNAILLNGQLLSVINDLSGINIEDAKAVRLFRPGQ